MLRNSGMSRRLTNCQKKGIVHEVWGRTIEHQRCKGILVAESGLNSRADLDRMALVGANCALVGESLMRQEDVSAATRLLLEGEAPHAANA